MIGTVFLVSGFEKVVSHYQNFLYVVQSYEFLPTVLEEVVARTLPWMELFLGLFLIIGLWHRRSLHITMGIIVIFLAVVAQAMIRGLPIDECGCFGSLITLPLAGVFVFDSTMLMLCILMAKNSAQAQKFSLDSLLAK